MTYSILSVSFEELFILVPRSHTPFGQHQESRPLAVSNNGTLRFTECCWTWPEVAILGADQKERSLWGRKWELFINFFFSTNEHCNCDNSQMAALELHDIDGPVLRENIYKAIDGLELPHQKVQQTLSDYM